jgi:uncharacterized membrane-anchored protein
VVVVSGEDGGLAQWTHLDALCRRLAAPPPLPHTSWHAMAFGPYRLRWEKHTELTAITVFAPLDPQGTPFATTALTALGEAWWRDLPGQVLYCAHAELRAGDALDEAQCRSALGDEDYAAASAAGGAIHFATDARPNGDGFERLLLTASADASPALCGRVLQKLFEIGAYRMAALLAFPVAQETRARLSGLEADLEAVVRTFHDGGGDRGALDRLTALSAQAEAQANATNYRFAAAKAYDRLVGERLEGLQEAPVRPDHPTLSAFLARRLAPAMRTCDAVAARQDALLERISRATRLFATRVQVTTEEQNAKLLASMDQRAALQLRLQETVEGLSVVALSYYALGIVGYLAKAMEKAHWPIEPNIAVGLAAIPTILAVWWFLRRVKKGIGH